MSLCFTCQTKPSGNAQAGPNSAYCAGCQPWPGKNLLGSGMKAAGCPRCGNVFTTDRNFDLHIRGGACLQPERAGLERKSSGRYGMPGRAGL